MIKVGLVYTSTTPELIELVEKYVKQELGKEVILLSYKDPTILEEVRKNGLVTTQSSVRLISMYMEAISDGVDAILNVCSSVGEVVDSVQDMSKYVGVPIVRVDEKMCREAAKEGEKIGVLATIPSTLIPTKNTILRVAREMGKYPKIIEVIIDGAFGVNQKEFKKLIVLKAEEIKKQVDIIVLCQGSMAFSEKYLEEKLNIHVLSSPALGAKALKEALLNIGKIEG